MVGHYIKVAIRNFRRAPGATAINVFALALGLTCFVVAFSAVTYWNNAERGFPGSDRIMAMTARLAFHDASIDTGVMPTTNDILAKYLRLDFPDLVAVARARSGSDTSVTTGEVKMRLPVAFADPQFTDIFRLPLVKGDPATALKSPNTVLITKEAALKLYGTTDVVGKFLRISNDLETTVAGVVGDIPQPSHLGSKPSSLMRFDVIASFDVYQKLQRVARRALNNGEPQADNWLGGYCCTTYVLLPEKGPLTKAAFIKSMKSFAARHVSKEQLARADLEFGAEPVNQLMVTGINSTLFIGSDVHISVVSILMVLGTLVLLVAAMNYANLATAQAATRGKEIGVRMAVGATRGQVMIQYLIEAWLVTLIATLVSLVVILLIAPIVRTSTDVDLSLAFTSGMGFWLFIVALIFGVTILAGSYPAFVLSRARPVVTLRMGKMRSGGRLIPALMTGLQFAAASFLLIAVAVMYSQSRDLEKNGLGSSKDQIVSFANVPFFTRVDPEGLRNDLMRVPGVKAVSSVGESPWSSDFNIGSLRKTPERAAATYQTYYNNVDYDFFGTMQIRLLAGRVFDREHGEDMPKDNNTAPTNVVVDDAFVKQLGFASPQAAIGQMVYFVPDDDKQPVDTRRIIGVVESRPLHLIGLGVSSNMYTLGGAQWYTLVRIAPTDIQATLAGINAAWDNRSKNIAMTLRFMDSMFAESYETFARINRVFNGLALFAIIISAIGLFGMATHVARRRLQEIGVRKTIGASTTQVVTMLVKDFSRPVVIANLIAWPAAYFAGRAYLDLFIHRISLTLTPFIVSFVLTLLIAWLAVGRQAWRAARVQPAQVLKYE